MFFSIKLRAFKLDEDMAKLNSQSVQKKKEKAAGGGGEEQTYKPKKCF